MRRASKRRAPSWGWGLALWPMTIGDETIWLELYRCRFMGEYVEVRTLRQHAASIKGEET